MISEESDMNTYTPLNELVISEKNVRVVSASNPIIYKEVGELSGMVLRGFFIRCGREGDVF